MEKGRQRGNLSQEMQFSKSSINVYKSQIVFCSWERVQGAARCVLLQTYEGPFGYREDRCCTRRTQWMANLHFSNLSCSPHFCNRSWTNQTWLWSPARIHTRLNALQRSNLVKFLEDYSLSNSSEIKGRGTGFRL